MTGTTRHAANGSLSRNVSAVRTQLDEVLPSVPTFRRHPNASSPL